MKKPHQPSTRISTISTEGRVLTDEVLRLVSGGRPANETGGTSKKTKPASMTNPGEVDTATDTGSD